MRFLCINSGADTSTKDCSDGIVKGLKALGHTVIPYALDTRIHWEYEYLQFMWHRQREFKPDAGQPTMADAVYLAGSGVVERALTHDVDWVFVVAGGFLHPKWFRLLKKAGIKSAVWLTESPYEDRHQGRDIAAYADILWTNERTSVPFLKLYCEHTSYLPHAYDPDKHHVFPDKENESFCVPPSDVIFVGTPFPERVDLLSQVNWDGINLGLYGLWSAPLFDETLPLQRYVRGQAVPNSFAAALYRQSKVCINLYRTTVCFEDKEKGLSRCEPEYAESMNPRAYELAACGVPYVSHYRKESEEIFGDLVPTFETAGELEALLRGLLRDEKWRKEIAEQLPLCVQGCTFQARAAQMVVDLESYEASGEVQCVASYANPS